MSHTLSIGAINKLTGDYVYPKIANKKDEYICPECNKSQSPSSYSSSKYGGRVTASGFLSLAAQRAQDSLVMEKEKLPLY